MTNSIFLVTTRVVTKFSTKLVYRQKQLFLAWKVVQLANDSARVRRLTGKLRRARVKIFILAYGSF